MSGDGGGLSGNIACPVTRHGSHSRAPDINKNVLELNCDHNSV